MNGFQDRKYLISQGVNKNKIIVAGQIRFDDIVKRIKPDREDICKKFGIDPKKKIIMFTAQKYIRGFPITESAKEVFFREIERLDKNKFQFIVTIRDDVDEKKDLPKFDKSLNVKIIKGGNIYELLSCCDIYSTAFSTVGIEAVLMGKPVVAINIQAKSEEYVNYTKLGVGFKITKENEFLPALKRCLYDKNFNKNFKKAREKFIKEYNYKMDGKALERIIKIIDG